MYLPDSSQQSIKLITVTNLKKTAQFPGMDRPKKRNEMLAQKLRKLLHEKPFRPFHVELVTGRVFAVPHPEFMLVPPKSRTMAFVVDDDGLGTVINTTVIERVTYDDKEDSSFNGQIE